MNVLIALALTNLMTKEQAQRLYNMQDSGHVVHFIGGPYVAEITSGEIEKKGETFLYSDSALCDIDVETREEDDFAAYMENDSWKDD